MKRNLLLCLWITVGLAGGALALPEEQHPVLLYDDATAISSRLAVSPYAEWWATAESAADDAISYSSTGRPEREKATKSKYLAFAYAMTASEPYGDKALSLLSEIDPGGDWGGEEHYWATPLMLYAEAYDMLKGAGHPGLDTETDGAIRDKLAAKADELADLPSTAGFSLMIPLNNWRIRMYCALDMVALALADESAAVGWHDLSLDLVQGALDHQLASDTEGGFAEGPHYLEYSADVYCPHMMAYRRVMGAAVPWANQLETLHDWGIKIRVPSGHRPNFDDAHLSLFYGWYFGSDDPRAPLYRWDWEQAAEPYLSDFRPDAIIDQICHYDTSVVPEAPTWSPTIFLPEAGQAAFRSDWTQDAVYLFLMGEHGPSRLNAVAHEHPDATSFILYAYGEMLALDGGYVSWDQRDLVNQAKNHNLILVDGEGPPVVTYTFGGETFVVSVGADSYLKDYYDTDYLDFCSDSTRYGEVDIVRDVWFVGERYFVLMDELDAQADHTYGWLLHGNGGGTSGGDFELVGRQATWTQNDAELVAYMAFPQSLSILEKTETHSFEYEQVLEHTYIEAQTTARDTRYMAVLSPKPAAVPEPIVSVLDLGEVDALTVTEESQTTLVAAQPGQLVLIPSSASGLPDLQTDAQAALASVDAEGLAFLAMHDASTLAYNGQQRVLSSGRMTLTLNVASDPWRGYVRGDETYVVELLAGLEPVTVEYKGAALDHAYADGRVELELSGEGELLLDFASGGGNVVPLIITTPALTATQGEAYFYDVAAIDFNFDDSLTFQLVTAPAGMTIDESTGGIHWVPSAGDVGEQSVTVGVSDGTETAPQSWTLSVLAVLTGDFDSDGRVGLADFVLFVDAYGTTEDSPGWDALFDLDENGTVGLSDFVIFVDNYGKTTGAGKPASKPAEPPPGDCVSGVEAVAPEACLLVGNHPNPFNAETEIAYRVGSEDGGLQAVLEIYSTSGQLVRKLGDAQLVEGLHRVTWDGRDQAGRPASSGVYVFCLRALDHQFSHRMVLLR